MKAIIFDLDGVIVTTDKFHYMGWKRLADEEGIFFNEQLNHRLRGVSRMESLRILLERAERDYSEEEKTALAARKNGYYRELLGSMTPDDVPKEVLDTLDELRRRGYKLAIGSSSANARFILERVGLPDYFDAVSDGTNITNSKPHPEVFLKAAAMLSLNPEDCLVVEDAKAGIDAAVSGGFKSAAIGDAAGYGREDFTLDTFGGLLSLCGQI
jgi:beta-phosphoglucomutase